VVIIDALDVLCVQLTRDLFAIAKFLFSTGIDSPAYGESILAREWTASPIVADLWPARLARDRHRDRQQDGQGENIMPRCRL